MSFLPKKQKSLSEFLPRGIDVLRTGIEPHMIISKYLTYEQFYKRYWRPFVNFSSLLLILEI